MDGCVTRHLRAAQVRDSGVAALGLAPSALSASSPGLEVERELASHLDLADNHQMANDASEIPPLTAFFSRKNAGAPLVHVRSNASAHLRSLLRAEGT